MTWEEIKQAAKTIPNFKCRVCKECNGIACRGELPGMGGKDSGMSFIRNYEAWQNVTVDLDTIYDRSPIDTTFELFGKTLKSPIMIAPIGGLEPNYGVNVTDKEYAEGIVTGAHEAGTLAFTGDGLKDEFFYDPTDIIDREDGFGIPTIKPWDEKAVFERIDYTEKKNVLALAMDIDAAGLPFLIQKGEKAGAKSLEELKAIVKRSSRPFILKGIMTKEGALKALEAGFKGIVVSNHGGRVLDLTKPTASVLPEIVEAVQGKMMIFVDGGIRSGVHVFKALEMGADAVLIGRPAGLSFFGGRALGDAKEGVRVYLEKIHSELVQTMKMTGKCSLKDIKK
ncbi:alpha-hydroxy-acid oxidizing protein [Guggenheimella bovis]